MKTSDFLVIGAGVAGLSFALRAAEHGRVAVITKGKFLDCSSAKAQGGIAAVWDHDDSFEDHVADTLDAGAGLCNEQVVRTIVEEGPGAIRELLEWGVNFDPGNQGEDYELAREGGHTKRRILHAKDATGLEITSKLLEAAKLHPNIELLEDHFAIDLITTTKLGLVTEDRVLGAYVLDRVSGEVEIFRSDRVLLATGGWALAALAREVPPPAYRLAAHRADVPAAVLYAVALQESGAMLRGRLIPWPWTLNVAGSPQRYATRVEACAGLHRALAHTPANRIDAGLGQVNLGYHTHRYTQPCELLDPYRNLAIAAEILREQHTPGEDWLVAIGRYHRPAGGAPAARYRRSVHQHLTRVLGPGASLPSARSPMP